MFIRQCSRLIKGEASVLLGGSSSRTAQPVDHANAWLPGSGNWMQRDDFRRVLQAAESSDGDSLPPERLGKR